MPVLAQDAQGRLAGLKLSGDQPIQIEADKLEIRENDSVAIYSGNVNVVQGPTQLKAGTMKVYYAKKDPNAPATAAASGGASIDRLEVSGKVYVKSEGRVATGDKGTFDMKSEILVLSGKQVVLTEGPNVLTGCTLTVNMKSGLAEVGGCGGRVKTLLTPGSQNK
nr:LptA/OstA family protein [Mesorhizobium sp. NBSH29]